MKFTEFLLLVSQMREAQRAFYRERKQSNLIAAKTAESIVDQAIRQATAELDAMPDARQFELDFGQQIEEGIKDRTVRTTTAGAPTLAVDERQENRHR